MEYIPHVGLDIEEMLKEIGVSSIEDLFTEVSKCVPFIKLDLPPALTELELVKELGKLSEKNINLAEYDSYLGAGCYQHFIPSAVKWLLQRGEFVTPYTPYQAETSQGVLQAIYEYQTLICELTGMDVTNASLYDGASSLAEAVLMTWRNKEVSHPKMFISSTVHPEYRRVTKTYTEGIAVELIEVPYRDGITDINFIEDNIDENVIGVVVQNPNFLGYLEPIWEIPRICQKVGNMSIGICNPVSLGVIKAPGEVGFDVAVGEAQMFGNPMAFGGPSLGFFACKEEYVRKMPGRIVGFTKDKEGKRGFVLTLQTREQHIRREKATSNICSNEALCAFATCVYLVSIGKEGLIELGKKNIENSHYLYEKFLSLEGVEKVWDSPFFNEFLVKLPIDWHTLLQHKIIGGLSLERFYPELKGISLWCVTETKRKKDMDRLIEVVKEAISESSYC